MSTLCNPVDCSLPGSSVHGTFQARIPEWVAISSSRASTRPGTKPESAAAPALAGGFFATEPPGKPHDVMCEGPAQSGETQPCAPLCPSPESRAGQLSFQLWPLTNAKTDASGGKPCRSRASLTAARVPEPLEQSLPPHPEHLTLITRNWPTFLQKKAVTLVRHLKTTSRGISPSSLILGALDGCR